ncbi:3 beta-hydroxysteroid dehydrogenase/Delta 5--_4-isomerase [Planctomycetes bacterium Pan216]|uniref:3 beta-hydroxysteroid dehydrogenase/Delta 5-->4-isomerase n=1 Tax=Kolteria novifilia TaxID=2527975 RepID=A0A518B815_9BACT|nr:3 beta-hydroxysteroid dehydrogenase/Delta 5-->4-isomerase [Planctomycetes bacterium Pan216]
MRCLVTGATGFLGGHVAETLSQRGDQVRTIARSTSDTSLLNQWNVEVVEGDMTDPDVLAKACDGVDAVIHCAAKVGDWGPLDEYRRVNVEGVDRLFDAVAGRELKRFVLVSSLGVYEARDHQGTDETAPMAEKHIDAYTQTKAESETLARERATKDGTPLTVIRPGFIYGPRDRTVMPRILKNLKRKLVSYFGSKEKVLNNVYVGNVVEAILLALDKPEAVGQVYNVTDDKCVTKQVFFETIAEMAGLPKPSATYPLWFAKGVTGAFEGAGRVFGFAPVLNSARLKFMGLNLDYSIQKAREELGYTPSTEFQEGMRRTIDWLRQEGHVESTPKAASEPQPS